MADPLSNFSTIDSLYPLQTIESCVVNGRKDLYNRFYSERRSVVKVMVLRRLENGTSEAGEEVSTLAVKCFTQL